MPIFSRPARWVGLAALLLGLSACNFPAEVSPTVELESTETDIPIEGASTTPTASLRPTNTGTSEPPNTPQGSLQAPTSNGSGCTDQAAFISDVTIDDNTELAAGEAF
ncbi:MAG: hypothetical protein PVG63_08165, partial [Anaerolineales bacterium]